MTSLAASLDSSPLTLGGASDSTVDDPSPEALVLGAGVGPRSAPGWLKRRVKRGLLHTAVLGIAGFFFIDNAAHIGGLAAGYAIGLLARRAARNDNSRLAQALDWTGWLSLALLACAAVFTAGRLLRAW